MPIRTKAVLTRLLPLVAAVAVAACSSGEQTSASTAPTAEETIAPTTEQTTTIDASSRDLLVLPEREGSRRETTGNVPHQQIGAEPVPAVDAELRRRAFLLTGVEDRESARSLPGARGLWLTDDVEIVRTDVLGGSREFAHIHPDGSLHVWLPIDRAQEVQQTKWGELHPWTNRDGFWDGVVMIYTPETLEEVEIAIRLLVDAYNFVTGASLDPDDFT